VGVPLIDDDPDDHVPDDLAAVYDHQLTYVFPVVFDHSRRIEPLLPTCGMLHDRHGPTGNSLISTECTKSLGPSSFNRDRCTNGITESMLHGLTMRGKPGFFTHHTAVHIADFKTRSVDHFGNLSEQLQGVRIFPLSVGVGKVLANVAKGCRTQQCLCNRMGDDIGITMAN
jgi:hypothetical protein